MMPRARLSPLARLSAPQRDLLRRLPSEDRPALGVRGAQLRVAQSLAERGYARFVSINQRADFYVRTEAGDRLLILPDSAASP